MPARGTAFWNRYASSCAPEESSNDGRVYSARYGMRDYLLRYRSTDEVTRWRRKIDAVFALVFATLEVKDVAIMMQNPANNEQKFASNALQNVAKWLPEKRQNFKLNKMNQDE